MKSLLITALFWIAAVLGVAQKVPIQHFKTAASKAGAEILEGEVSFVTHDESNSTLLYVTRPDRKITHAFVIKGVSVTTKAFKGVVVPFADSTNGFTIFVVSDKLCYTFNTNEGNNHDKLPGFQQDLANELSRSLMFITRTIKQFVSVDGFNAQKVKDFTTTGQFLIK